MEHKAVNFIIQGMQRDLNVARYDQNFAYENMNIRLTAMNDNTLLAITNEKGNKKLLVKDDSGNNITILGNYVGHCIVGKYLVLFTTNNNNDYIYRLHFNNDVLIGKILSSNKINLNENYPIEALGVYETENIQKVYWVDGLNPIRYINIISDKYTNNTNTTVFDFTGDVPFPSDFTVSKVNDSSGEFASGVIQYAYSFFDKNGRESNIVDISSLNYITNSNRGANAETVCNNTFKINISGINNKVLKYDYIRIYSIHRTSLNGIPSSKIVEDIKLSYTDNQVIQYIDNGTVGSNIDPYELLYKGGKSIIPNTIAQKDNTLFLGNYKTKTNIIPDNIKTELKNCSIQFDSKSILSPINDNSFYNYTFQLDYNSSVISSFKQGETYRFGVQLQDKRGEWSEVVYIKDVEIPYSISTNNDNINLPKPYIVISSNIQHLLLNNGYVNIRGTVVYPSNVDKTIIAQGILCPTVFNLNNRTSKNVTAQSSWFIRPLIPYDMESNTNNAYDNTNGATLEFRHEYIVPVDNSKYNMEIGVAPSTTSNSSPVNPWGEEADAFKYSNSLYYVDQSILTFHSPEFIFSEEYSNIDNINLKLRIVGFVPISSFVSDISISTESSGLFKDKIKDYLKPQGKGTKNGYNSLSSGLFYEDAAYSTKNDSGYRGKYNYLVFPWHRNGSLNDTPKVSADKLRTAILKKKTMSNLKYSFNSIYLNKASHWEAYISGNANRTGISKVRLFNSNELSVVKIPQPTNSTIGDIVYMGNIDTIATGYNLIYIGSSLDDGPSTLSQYKNDEITDAEGNTILSEDPVSIKYKSTPHLVFALNYTSNGMQRVLPALNGLNVTKRNNIPIWSSNPDDYTLDRIGSTSEGYDKSKTYTILYDVGGGFPSYGDINKLDDPDKVLIFENGKFYRVSTISDGLIEWKEVIFDGTEYFKYYNGDEYIYYVWRVNWNISTNSSIYNESLNINTEYGGLYLAELYKDVENRFGGEANENNLWYPSGPSTPITQGRVEYKEGDTFYQRFDCLKTYPYTNEDQNSIVEIVSFMCETHINIDGRYDKNRGQINNLNMSPTNFNLFNIIYNQKNNFFNYRILSDDFNNTNFPTTITWSLNKNLGEKIDSWTKINLTSILDLDGNNGELQKLEVLNNELYSFQDKAIAKVLFNSRVQIPVTDGVPIEIANSGKVDGKVYLTQDIGTINKWSVLTTPNGIYFIDNNNFGIYLLGNGIKCISDMLNMSSVIKEHKSMKQWSPKDMSNFRCFYDRINSDIYFVNKSICLCYNELLGQFTSYYNYEGTPMMINIEDKFLSYKDNYIWEFFKGDYNSFYGEIKPFYITWVANPEPMRDKIFNNLDFRSDTYFDNTLLNRTFDTLEVWNEYQRGKSKLANIIGRPSSLKRKFRIWRAQIPRHNNSLQRIRNPWCYIKLSMDNPSNYKTIFYDATLTYSV